MKALLSSLGILFLCVITVRAQDPEISENILPEIRRMGVPGILRCAVINQMDNPVYWIHADTQTTISKDDKIEIDEKHNELINGWPKYQVEKTQEGKSNIYTITINRLEPRDAGTYTCQILVRGSNRHPSKDGQMVVLVPPAVMQSRTSHTITARSGDSVNLTCDASGHPYPNITWVRVSGDPLPNGKLRFQSKILHIPHVRTRDRGIYRCLADNNVRPPATHDATLLVAFRPTAFPVQSSYGQAENRMFDVTIECRIAGLPEPDLQWYKELSGGAWQPITNDDKHTVNILLNHANILGSQERWFQLVIRSVQANDFGDYICEGKNAHGSGFAKVHLFATSECQGPNCPAEGGTASDGNGIRINVGLLMAALVSYITLRR